VGKQLLERVGVSEQVNKYPGQLSGGQQQGDSDWAGTCNAAQNNADCGKQLARRIIQQPARRPHQAGPFTDPESINYWAILVWLWLIFGSIKYLFRGKLSYLNMEFSICDLMITR
jgi:hypothetical protein